MPSFLGELKRRKVVQVAAVYAVVAWLLVQIVATVEEPLRLPEWFDTAVIVLLLVGFPIAVISSWAFDLTSQGVVRDRGTSTAGVTRRAGIEYVLLVLLVVAVGWVLYRVEFSAVPAGVSARAGVLPNSIAVLPLENLSPDTDDAFLAAGLHEELLNQLAKLGSLTVISRTAVMRYADIGTRPSIREIAEALNVATVMEGSVRYAGDRIRVTVQLIDSGTDAHLWSETYEESFDDIFAVETAIATSVADALQAEFSPEDRQRLERPLTRSADAYALYLRAIELGQPSNSGVGPNDALHGYLDEALALDPTFARAHALKAFDYSYAMVRRRTDMDPAVAELERFAWEHAGRALLLDPDENVAYVAMANVSRFTWRADEAQAAFERALALAPNDFSSLLTYAFFSMFVGDIDRAVELARRAAELNPSGGVHTGVLLRTGRTEEAYAARLASTLPPAEGVNGDLAVLEWLRGDREAALAVVREGEALAAETWLSDENFTTLGRAIHLYGQFGSSDDAHRLFDRLVEASSAIHVKASDWVRAYLGIRDTAEALAWMRRIDEQRNPEDALAAAFLSINDTHDPVLEEPEFVELRRRLALRD